jgi:hypothetical protein
VDFFGAIRGLIDADLAFVVVGGVAARLQGSDYLTNDLDICYEASPENLERLAAIMRRWHAHLRGVEPGLPFFMDARQLRLTPTMTLAADVGDIDVLAEIAGVGDYAACLAASDNFDIRGVPFKALSLGALIKAKRSAGRPKDRLVLPTLEALHRLRRSSEGSTT